MALLAKKNKKLVLTMLATFIAVFVTDWLIHGLLLQETYHRTAQLWRSEADMHKHIKFLFLGQLLVSVFFAFIFTKGYEKKGIAEGIRFGALIAALQTGYMLINHAVSPYPVSLTVSWIILGFIQLMIVGAVTTFVYSRK